MGSLSRFNLNRIMSGYNTTYLFETGTFWGDGVAYALKSAFAKIISVEIIPEIAAKAKERFAEEEKVNIIETDSISALKAQLPIVSGNTLFWLDAHYPGADAGLATYNGSRDETLRLPLHKEIEIICKLRSGFNDVFIIDDLRIYEDGPYESGNAPIEALPRHNRNIDFIYKFFSKTHLILKIYQDEGYILMLPKKNYDRNHFNLRDLLINNPFSKERYLNDKEIKAVWNSGLDVETDKRISELCKARDSKMIWYQQWCNELREPVKLHRKQWEYAYILQALSERGCIAENQTGMVFAVGTEPLPAILAKYGCHILATDIQPLQGGDENLEETQLAFEVGSLNRNGICENDIFNSRVKYRSIDMNDIPPDIIDLDFNWSSCSFQHLGSREKGFAFLRNQLKTLKPGGWAVHTTEYNVSSNDGTLENENTVVYRQRDIDFIVSELRSEGHFVEELDYSIGGLEEDFIIDLAPYTHDPHLKLQLDRYIVTSIGLIIQRKL